MYQIQNKTDDIMLGLLLANEADNLYTIIANQFIIRSYNLRTNSYRRK